MRIIKMKNACTEAEINEYFEGTSSEIRQGKFTLDKGTMALGQLAPGEKLLFSHRGFVLYLAEASSSVSLNQGKKRDEGPLYFKVNLLTLQRVKRVPLSEVERVAQKHGERKKLTRSQRWPKIEDAKCSQKVWEFIVSEKIPMRLNLEGKIAEVAENELLSYSGQGFQVDSRMRKTIEDYSIEKASKYFEEKYHYQVEPVGKPYDLRCTKGTKVLLVEVKGTQADGTSVILTPNEVLSARKHKTALYVLHSIRLNGTGRSRKPTHGTEMVLNPWKIDQDGDLESLSFTYKIKNVR